MLFFLRKIRKQLLSEYRFGKYLLYALGEIILVVVGIVIAVQLGNWNQAKNDRKKELSYLQSYTNDLNANITELDRVITKSGYMQQIADTLIRRYVRGESVPQPELDSMIYELIGYTLYLSKEGTTENLLGAGSLELIQNLTIRQSFVTQEADQKRLREVEKGIYESFAEMLLYLKHNVDLYYLQLGQPMIDELTQSKLMADRYFKNLLDDVSIKCSDAQRLYQKRKEELVDLLKIVEGEVQKLQ